MDNDGYYFESYARAGIHYDMLRDEARTVAYQVGIEALREEFKSRAMHVVDVGCGTGILSLFAARAGAARVTAIDASSIAADAAAHVAANGMDAIITVVRGKAEEVLGSTSTADVIVSEWMGYACLFESMLPSVLRVRDACLARGGYMLPSHARLWLAPVSSVEVHERTAGFWRDVYGFNMDNMMRHVVVEAQVDVVPPEAIMGVPPSPLKEYNLLRVSPDELDLHRVHFTHAVAACGDSIACSRVPACACNHRAGAAASAAAACDNMCVHAFAFWFDTLFTDERYEGASGGAAAAAADVKLRRVTAVLDTAPACTTTHWKQTLLLLPQPFCAAAGTLLRGSISFTASRVHTREYDFTLELSEPAHAGGSWTFNMR